MASAHKKIWTKTVDGVTVRRETAKYYAHYVDHLGKHRAIPGYEDKRRTERLAWRLEEEAEALRRGDRPTMSALSGEPVSALIARYGEYLAAADRSEKHCNMVLSQLRRMYNDVARPQDITREAVAGVMLAMKEAGSSAQTRKHYLVTTKAFVAWMVKAKAIPHHFLVDIADLPAPNVARGRRHRRRTVPTGFLDALYQSMHSRDVVRFGLSALDRVWLYTIAGLTGYRASELAALTPAHFILTGQHPTVQLEGEHSKRGEAEGQPLPTLVVDAVAAWLRKKPRNEPVWPGRWAAGNHAAGMLKKDMAAAREDWVAAAPDEADRAEREASHFLLYKDGQGKAFDFHALRYYYTTSLVKAGHSVAVVQKLARHSDPKLTLNIYTDLGINAAAAAAETLPLPAHLQPAAYPACNDSCNGADGGRVD